MAYNWLYTTSNDNVYILVLVIIILGFIILNFNLWKKKTDKFYNVDTSIPNVPTIPPLPTLASHNFIMTEAEKQAWRDKLVSLDGDEEAIAPPINLSHYLPQNSTNDIMSQKDSTLYSGHQIGSVPTSNDTSTIGDYATLDSLGSMMTDTLGGVKSSLGYSILEDQLGMFTQTHPSNDYTYDNTINYKSGMSANTVDGVSTIGSGLSGQFTQDNKPIFLQKDFAGVANIFAPNIIIQNPPLTSDGYPDISYQM